MLKEQRKVSSSVENSHFIFMVIICICFCKVQYIANGCPYFSAAAEKDSLQSTETPPSKDEPNSWIKKKTCRINV